MLRLVPFKIRKWFPPGDPVATAVVMLCVLREDLLLELQGIIADKFERLDDNQSAYRRTYFWRNSLRTLEEIKKTLNWLNSQPEFRDMLAREPVDIRKAFEELKRELNKASEAFLRVLRNHVGGHLDASTVQAGLDSMDHEQEGMVQFADTLGNIRYRFAVDVLWTALLREVPGDDTESRLENRLRPTASLTPAVKAIDDVVACYLRARGLAS
jgi:hypothetical protein